MIPLRTAVTTGSLHAVRSHLSSVVASVLLLADRLEPFGRDVDVERQMHPARAGYGAVPMFLTRRDHDRISCLDILRRLFPALHTNGALDDEEPLRARVNMPIRSRAGFELDAINVDRGPFAVRGEQLGSRRPHERIRVGGTRRGVETPKDFHDRCP